MLSISNFCPPESNGSSITQHVRELVKDCIERAKITNEIQDEKVSHCDDTSLENNTLFADATSQQQKEEKIAQVGMSYLYRVSKKKLTALKCKLVAPNPIGTKHIK